MKVMRHSLSAAETFYEFVCNLRNLWYNYFIMRKYLLWRIALVNDAICSNILLRTLRLQLSIELFVVLPGPQEILA